MFCRILHYRPDTVPGAHYRNSLRATGFIRISKPMIHRSTKYEVATNSSFIMYHVGCTVDAVESPLIKRNEDQGSLVNNKSSSTSVAAVIASGWC